jgi:hypothetical protein
MDWEQTPTFVSSQIMLLLICHHQYYWLGVDSEQAKVRSESGGMVGLPKKKKTKFQKTTFKQKVISIVVIVVPSLIVLAWLIVTVMHNPAPK